MGGGGGGVHLKTHSPHKVATAAFWRTFITMEKLA